MSVTVPNDAQFRRQARPSNVPLPETFKWVASLPREVRPLALFLRCGRHDEVFCVNVLGSEPYESIERIRAVAFDECFDLACRPDEDGMPRSASDRLFVPEV